MSNNSDNNFQLKELLERITKKVENSPALNGGWDKMVVVIEHIREKQDETCEKVDKIQNSIYEPDTGLFSRVKTTETMLANFNQKYHEHVNSDEKNLAEINENLKKIGLAYERADDLATKVKKIAGEDLENMKDVLKARSLLGTITSKMMWLVAGGALAAIGKTFWETISK